MNHNYLITFLISALVLMSCGDKKWVTEKPDALAEGKRLFMNTCASCHGYDGKGETTIGKSLKAGNLTEDKFKNGDSVDAIAATIFTGVHETEMKSLKGIVTEDQAKMIATYVRTLR